MIKPVSNLKKVAQDLPPHPSAEEKSAFLNRALELFSVETERLENSYALLKEHLKALTYELEESNKALNNKVNELDYVTHYLNTILSNITQGILFLDLNGSITTYNTAAEFLLEVPAKEVLFEQFWKNFADDLFGFSLREALSDHKFPKVVFTSLPTKHGEQRELEIHTTLVLNMHKRSGYADENVLYNESMQGIILLLNDITEMRHLQMLASRNDRMKELGEMAAMVAHEIRNPLGGIKGFATLLHRDLKDLPEMQHMASHIIEGTDHLNRLVTQVLNYARPVHPHFESTDIVLLMQELVGHILADESFDHGRIQVSFESNLDELTINVDPQIMKSAILNLIVNGIQSISKQGQVIVSVKEKNEHLFIEIKDTGSGISVDNMEKIFSPFFTTKEKGNGLGLSEVHKSIQAHRGEIHVDSKEGKGTLFTIKLPLKA